MCYTHVSGFAGHRNSAQKRSRHIQSTFQDVPSIRLRSPDDLSLNSWLIYCLYG